MTLQRAVDQAVVARVARPPEQEVLPEAVFRPEEIGRQARDRYFVLRLARSIHSPFNIN